MKALLPESAGRLAVTAGLAIGLMAIAGCEAQIDVRGNMPDPQAVSTIKPGQSTRAAVETALGTPSTVATFDSETWYYVGGRVKTVSFMRPELLERKVIAVKFDSRGVVEDVRQLDAEDGKPIAIVQRETPTKGKELTVIQQLIGNIGRFGGQQRRPDDNTGQAPGP
jgi:outer membrane protein assembly factor BamE (lipoprotein component of BamABCDE complex)